MDKYVERTWKDIVVKAIPDFKRAQANNNDLIKVGSALAKERTLSSPNNFTVNFGPFTSLRASLAKVKTS